MTEATSEAFPLVKTQLPAAASSSERKIQSLWQITDNPFFTAGIGLAGLGAGFAALQRGVRHGASIIKRSLLVDVEISIKDDTYPWFLQWMTLHQQRCSTIVQSESQSIWARVIKKLSPRVHHLSIKTEKIEHSNGTFESNLSLVPGPGRHMVIFQNAIIKVERLRETKSMDITKGRPWETITLTTLFAQRHVFRNIFLEVHKLAQESIEGKIIVYTSRGTSWEVFGEPRRKRPMDSVILDRGVKEKILDDVEDFLKSQTWYESRGIPYRRGYLLYGPPGTGKTSFIQALAGNLNYNIAMLNLSERGLTDDRLNFLLSVLPPRTLILLEDVDAAFRNKRVQTDEDGYRGANVTFSGLLNALDGVASAEERLLFLTTNHVNRLDPALIRPGRVDLSISVGALTLWQCERLWDRFYGDLACACSMKGKFITKIDQLQFCIPERENQNRGSRRPLSAAALQGVFLRNKQDMQGAINMMHDLADE